MNQNDVWNVNVEDIVIDPDWPVCDISLVKNPNRTDMIINIFLIFCGHLKAPSHHPSPKAPSCPGPDHWICQEISLNDKYMYECGRGSCPQAPLEGLFVVGVR